MAVGALEKMTIHPADKNGDFFKTAPITVMFNPKDFNITRKVNWKHVPVPKPNSTQEFVYPDPATLNITFVFDVYERNDVKLLDLIKPIQDLSTIYDEAHHPLACQLWWGSWCVFQGVMASLGQTFTLFHASGAPARVNLVCTFSEHYPEPPSQPGGAGHSGAGTANPGAPELKSADVAKTHLVRQGDTLHGIARRQYNDPALWRPIADANRIADPLHLPVGAVLLIPSIATGTRRR